MKREAVGSTKMKKLCKRLNLQLYMGIGILEAIWHLTAREAPQGDIGKLPNEDIALGIDYEGDSDQLIDALVDSRWLDRSDTYRLVVHDWHEHADDALDMRLARSGKLYANGSIPRMNKLSRRERDTICQMFGWSCDFVAQKGTESHDEAPPVPVPEPVPAPVPEPEKEQEPSSIASTTAAVKSAEVVTIWNELTQGKLPQAKSTLNRQKVIQTRLKEPGWLPDFRAACAYLAETPWYTGHNDRQWVANIDFALQAGKATELAEKATQQAPQSAGAMNHGNVQHHRTATDQRYIDQLAARDERRAREATEHPEAALPVLQ
jgi:hypothetical protein